VNSRKSWLIFGFATFAYVIAVLQRSSLGVAGVDATERFGISAAVLSTLAVVQLIVYAGLQIPVGIALDRVGPRFLILLGAGLMVAGQTTLALAPDIGVAILGRMLVGAGDAMTFISVLRLLSNWFSGRTLPLASQLLGTVGALGQVLSAIPLSILLHSQGWSTAFLTAAAVSLVALVGVLLVVQNGVPPATRSIVLPGAPSTVLSQLRENLSRPGTRLGFWSHFVTQSSGTVFSLLWGFPFLSIGLGYGATVASILLTLIVASAAVFGPMLGIVSARFPMRRSNVVLAIVASMAVCWTLVLVWPGQPPVWTVVLLIVVIGIGGPGSLIGFDFARTFNPLRSLGSATGIVNVGGFLASFVMMFLIGTVLDALDSAAGGTGVPKELYALDSFRIAFLVQYVVVGIGVVFLIRSRRQTRRRLHEQEGIQVAPLWVAIGRAWRRRSS
jgi:sugar phosphate permease